MIESIAVHLLRQVGQHVVRSPPDRREPVGGNPSVRGIRGERGIDNRHSCEDRNDKDREHSVSKHLFFRRVGEAVFELLPFAGEVGNDVLHHAQRADHRAVDTPEHESHRHPEQDDRHVGSQQRREELQLGKEAEIRMQRPREVEEQPRDERPAHNRRPHPYCLISVFHFSNFNCSTSRSIFPISFGMLMDCGHLRRHCPHWMQRLACCNSGTLRSYPIRKLRRSRT